MGLSEKQKEWLKARYDAWGVDRVRQELARADRDLFAHPDITAFARNWIEDEEASRRRVSKWIAILAIAGAIQLGIALALMIGY